MTASRPFGVRPLVIRLAIAACSATPGTLAVTTIASRDASSPYPWTPSERVISRLNR